MEKYNIKIDRALPTQEEINKGMDLEKVKAKANAYRKHRSGFSVIVASLVVALIIGGMYWIKKDTLLMEPAATNVLPSSNTARTYLINAEKDTTLFCSSGTIIHIPARSLVDINGDEIKGNVELDYREFHNLGEIILSDIPMTYDSAGKQYHFESAGMFEIRASKERVPVFIKENSPIEVMLSSVNDDLSKFNQYYYDTSLGNWRYLGKDIPLDPKDFSLETSKDTSAFAKVPIDLIKPMKYNPERFHFSIEVDRNEFPELKLYDEVVFEVSPETKNYDPSSASIQWEDASIEKLVGTEKYKVTFVAENKEYMIIAYPVFKSEDYASAMKEYERLHALYQVKHGEKKAQEAKHEEKLETEVKDFERLAELYRQQERLNQQQATLIARSEEIVYRTFQVRNFGIWNSDCPYVLPAGERVMAEFRTIDGKKVKVSSVFLIESGRNTAFSFGNGNSISFNPEVENTLLVITADNSLGWFSKDEFKAIAGGTKNYTFKLNMKHKKEYTPMDIMEIL